MLSALLFPRTCQECGEALIGSSKPTEWEFLCSACASELRAVGVEACIHCSVPVYGVISGKRICMSCRENPPVWDEVKSLVRYCAAARNWVRQYKYNDARHLEREWTKLLRAPQYSWLKTWLSHSILVPVPLHPLKKLLRGFNQSELLAKSLLKTLSPANSFIAPHLLRRIRYTRPQARLRRAQRHQNVKDAFAINLDNFAKLGLDKPRNASTRNSSGVISSRIILVDDLLTTGFTLMNCATLLKKSGVPRVDVFTLARG